MFIVYALPIRVTVIDTIGSVQHTARWLETPGRHAFRAHRAYIIDRADWLDADGNVVLSLPGHEIVPNGHAAEGQWFTVTLEVVA